MTHPVRVIARMDIKGPNLIKGIQFDGHRVLGTSEQAADRYYKEGVDEIFFQDTVASLYRRNSLLEIVSRTAKRVFIPITVAGGLRSIADIREVLNSGADKVAINTAATENPNLISEAAKIFGSQCIVASIEAFRTSSGKYQVWTDYGRETTQLDAIEWAKRVEDLGAGEIMLTSINRDGTGRGFDLELVSKVANSAKIPVIASGGAGKADDLVRAVREGRADAVAVGSLFHYNFIPEGISKEKREIPLRMGAPIDTGNWDFYYSGYGHQKGFNVEPCSVAQAKRTLLSADIPVRV
ncbi:MAG: imidazole glycerol phosphate synthase cyclase subunit [Bdellovibrionota bacterium]